MGRLRTILLVVLAGALLAPATAAPSGTAEAASLDVGVLVGINAIRVQHELAPLTLSAALSDAAQAHSADMVANGYFSHDSLDGAPFWQRIERYYPVASSRSWSVGENLLWTSGTSVAPGAVVADWMASPPHRENILNPGWRQIGIGAASSPDAPGTYGGRPVIVVTTDFGARG
jgi:uncharacterized protein YkwD